MEINQLKNILEAALLAASQPQALPQLGALFVEEDAVGHDDLARAIDALREDCTGRGVELVEVASGYRYQVRHEVHPWVARLWTERPSRYSRALLETLSLIAYRQPITRGEIEQIRGVVVSSNIIRTLEEREWIRVVGHRDAPGKPALFGTTRTFLDYFSLKSLDELPPLADILDMESLDPQLDFDGSQPPAARAALPDDDEGEVDAGMAGGSTVDESPADEIPGDTDGDTGELPVDDDVPDVADDGIDASAGDDDTGDTLTDTTNAADAGDAAAENTTADAVEAADDALSDPPTADEAETPADADEDASATQDIKENRA
jgi:segregation and condensation protein B